MKNRTMTGFKFVCVLMVLTPTLAKAPEIVMDQRPMLKHWYDPIVRIICTWPLDCNPDPIPGVWTPSVSKRP